MKIIYSNILFGMIFLCSCRYSVQQAPVDYTSVNKKKNETLLNMNNYVARRNQELIGQFVKRTKLEMKETGSGLWYGIYEKGKGKAVNKGDKVEFSYILKLLDGTPVDSAMLNNPKIFRSGKGGVEAGLEEGILLLHEGDHAFFIIPPHLAYGNFGDQERIPPGAFLFYDLCLVSVNPK
jgi:FKBP-type peptidyl-prolyl cis-trans isomerase FkpA